MLDLAAEFAPFVAIAVIYVWILAVGAGAADRTGQHHFGDVGDGVFPIDARALVYFLLVFLVLVAGSCISNWPARPGASNPAHEEITTVTFAIPARPR